jgi:hypothetical protein
MNLNTLQDSVSTSVSMKIFKNKEDALFAHIFKFRLFELQLSIFKDVNKVDNFNPSRLQQSAIKAYPLNDRPRGDKDINSVRFHQEQLQQKINIAPIWIVRKNNKYILLDGVHRIVASYIEEKQYINANVIIL